MYEMLRRNDTRCDCIYLFIFELFVGTVQMFS